MASRILRGTVTRAAFEEYSFSAIANPPEGDTELASVFLVEW